MNNDNQAIHKPLQVQLNECKAALAKAVKDADALAKARDRALRDLREYQEDYERQLEHNRNMRKERDGYLKDLMQMQDELARLERRMNPVPGGWEGNNEAAPHPGLKLQMPRPGAAMRPQDIYRDPAFDANQVVQQVRERGRPAPDAPVANVPAFVIDAAKDAVARAEDVYKKAYQIAVANGGREPFMQDYMNASKAVQKARIELDKCQKQKAKFNMQLAARAAAPGPVDVFGARPADPFGAVQAQADVMWFDDPAPQDEEDND